jgi:hypothetical protein
MSIAAIKAGRAFYEIFAEDKTGKGLSSAEARLQRFGVQIGLAGAAMASFAAAGLGTLGALATKFATFGDEIGDAMAKTGVSPEWLQVFDVAADKADVSFNQIVASIGKMQRSISDGKIQKGLDLIGMSVTELQGKKPEEQFLIIGDAIGKIKDPALRSAAAVAIFGKAGMGLLPLFEGGAQDLIDMFNTLSEGGMLDEKDIAMASKLDDSLVMLRANIQGLFRMIGAAVAPAMTVLVDLMGRAVRAAAKFVDNNRLLVNILGGVLVAVGAVGVALMALGAAAIFASLASSGLVIAMGAVGFLLSPMAATAALIIAWGAAAATAVYYMDQLFNAGRALQFVGDAAEHAAMQVQVLLAALTSGEWQLAADFIQTSIEQAFDGAIMNAMNQWNSLLQFIGANPMDISGAQDDAINSSIRLGELVAKIAAKSANRKIDNPLSRATFDSASSGLRDIQTAGFLSSAAVGRIGQSSPANQWQEKMLEAAEETNDLLEEMRDGLGRLESLTVE